MGDSSWRYLLSHHPSSRYSRTLRIAFRRTFVHLCARCTGQVAGAIAYLATFLTVLSSPALLPNLSFEFVVALLPAPAAIDWFTQAIGRRESNNSLRIVSGALLGFAGMDFLMLLLTQHWILGVGALLVVAIYLIALMGGVHWSGAIERIVREHFPETVSE